jgi:hypothetical protein
MVAEPTKPGEIRTRVTLPLDRNGVQVMVAKREDADGTKNGGRSWGDGHHLHPDGKGLCLPDMRDGHLQEKNTIQVISNTLDAGFCVEAYEEAVSLYGSPEIINIDQGSQFTSDAFVAAVATSGARLSMDGKGAWTDNIFIERFWRSLKYEEVYQRADESVLEAKRSIHRYIDKYNSIRQRASLGGNTPNEIHEQRPTAPLLMAS